MTSRDSLDVGNMVINFSLTAGGLQQNGVFLAPGGSVLSKFDMVIPKTPVYEGMVVWILKY